MNLTLKERLSLGWQAIKGSLDVRQGSLAASLLQGIWPSVGGEPPKRQVKQYLDTYNQMPWARAPVERISIAVSMLHWRLFYEVGSQKDELGRRRAIRSYKFQRMANTQRKSALRDAIGVGKVEEVETHILLDALHAGNSMLSGQAIWKSCQAHMLLVGESFWMKERNALGGATAFWPLPSYWILDTPTPMNPFYRVSFRAWQGFIPESEIVWFKNPDPVNPYGRGSGIAQALGDELETDEYAAKFVKQFFFNDATPKFMVFPKGEANNMGEEQAKGLERKWLNDHQGFWRMGKPRFMNREIGIHEFAQNFQHLQMSELRNRSRDTSLQVYGINPEITGVIENSNRATIDGAAYFFQKFVIEPWAEFWRSEMQQKLISDYDERLILDYDSPVQEDREYTLKAYTANKGTVTVDEWRKQQGLPPFGEEKGGNLRFMAVNETLEDGFEETPDEPVVNDDAPVRLAAEIHRLTPKQLQELEDLTKEKR